MIQPNRNVPPFELRMTGTLAERLNEQIRFFPKYEKLVLPDWNGRFEIFQSQPRDVEFICTESQERFEFLDAFYRHPTAIVVEIQRGDAKSAPREIIDQAIEYLIAHQQDFDSFITDMANCEAAGLALGALAFRMNESMQPKRMHPVDSFQEFDSPNSFFYVSSSNSEVWSYLDRKWLQGTLMIDADIKLPEGIQERLHQIYNKHGQEPQASLGFVSYPSL